MVNVSFPKLGISLDVENVAIQIGGFSVYWYGLIIGGGFLLALVFAMRNLKRFGVDPDSFFDCVLAGLFAGIIGARLYYVFFRWEDYSHDLMKILDIHSGGLAIYGGVIGGLGVACIVGKIRKANIPAMLDIGGMGFLIGQGIGRWGNFFNQEAFGTPTDLPWGMVSEKTGGIAVHPCFLYESVWCLLGFGVLYLISRKWRRFDGQMFLLYIIWYGSERMIVEGLRTDSLYTPVFGLRVSQVLSGVLVIAGTVLLVLGLRKAAQKAALSQSGEVSGASETEEKVPEKKSEPEYEPVSDSDDGEKKTNEDETETEGKKEEKTSGSKKDD